MAIFHCYVSSPEGTWLVNRIGHGRHMAQELASLQEQLQSAKAQQEAAGAPERSTGTGGAYRMEGLKRNGKDPDLAIHILAL